MLKEDMTLARFTVLYVFYGILLALVARGLECVFTKQEILTDIFWISFIFLFILTYIAYVVSYIGVKKTPQTGVFAMMGGIILKLLFALSFALVVIMKLSVNQLVFALNYFSLYFLFTLFEVMCLLRNLRHQNNK